MSAGHDRASEAAGERFAAPPLVSLVVPFFDDRATIRRAVESALAQRYPRLEVIAVDDGSSDESAGELSDLVEAGQIQLLRQPNQGLGAARDTGVRQAGGEFVGFVDADDTIHPDKVSAQVECLRATHHPAIAYCGSQVFSGRGKFLRIRGCRERPELFLEITAGFRDMTRRRFLDPGTGLPADASQFMAKTTYEEIGGFRRDLRLNTGFEFATRASQAGVRFWLVNAPLYVQFFRPGSGRTRFDGRIESLAEALAEIDRSSQDGPKLGAHLLQITFRSFDSGTRKSRAQLWRLLRPRRELSKAHTVLLRCGALAPTVVTRPLARLFRGGLRRLRRRRQERLDTWGWRQVGRVEERFGD